MDIFKDCLNNDIDLDDLNNYPPEWRGMGVHDLFSKCMDKAGHSLFYMNHLHSGTDWSDQEERVKILCKELSDLWHYTRNLTSVEELTFYHLNLAKWLYRFYDEVENQC